VVRCTFSPARAWRPAVGARLARTLGHTKHTPAARRLSQYMSSIIVRQAVFSDLGELAELFDQYRVSQGKDSDLSAARAFLQARFDHGESVVFIAFENSLPLGFAQLYPSYSSTSLARVFILNDLFVHEMGRRKGGASRLLAALEVYALGSRGRSRHVERRQGQRARSSTLRGSRLEQRRAVLHVPPLPG
jgi:GNAT superfamily N-acetyltransferase